MDTTLLILTLLSFILILHVYIGYPIVLWLLSKVVKPKVVSKDESYFPEVTLMISCYNEVDVIEEKIQNSLALIYPKEQLNIMIISDGSDDGTDDVAKLHSGQGVKLIRQEGRLGKTSAINLAMQQTTADIVVFSDANAMYQPDALNKLIRNFNDDSVGYVVGAALYTDGNDNSAAASEDLYWRYEIALKTLESNLHSVVGGDGAIYAIRRELFKTLDAKDINDFVNPLQIIEQGYRGIFDKEAICFEETAGNFSKEYKRKQRIVNRSFRGLMKVKAVLNPCKFGFYSFEVISHKLLRWLQPIFLVIAAIGSTYFSYANIAIFQYIALTGFAFLFLAQIGFLQASRIRSSAIFTLPYYFVMVNYYSLIGVFTALAGNVQVTWSTPRQNSKKTSLTYQTKGLLLLLNLVGIKFSYDIVLLMIS